jgi:HTH-type transcriptional regulator/antitoxin HigA
MPKPIHTKEEYDFAKSELSRLWGSEAGTEAQVEAETWAILIDVYERAKLKPNAIDPVDYIKAEMEMNGRSKADLGALIGATRVSEILGRRRKLSISMIRALSEKWGIPADLLIADYALTDSAHAERSKVA